MKKLIILFGAVVVLGGIALYIYGRYGGKSTFVALPTYFTYSDSELTAIKGISSDQTLTSDDLYRWDRTSFELVSKNTLRKDFNEESSKIYAYLAVAQRDFAFLSFNHTKGVFAGNIDPLSKEVLCTFSLLDCESVAMHGSSDAYSEALSKIVFAKVQERMSQDKAGLTPYPILKGEQYWDGPQPSIGIENGNSKGWFITSGDQFRAPPPPAFNSPEFKAQLKMTQDALRGATAEQKHATVFWAGGPGTKTPPGQLLELGDTYMKEKGVPVKKVLLVRSVLTMAVADAVTAVFDSKYTYFVRRPFMMDPTIVTIMPTPNHPSYAAGHSTLSTAGATVLIGYFPEDTVLWKAKALEAGMSRIWGGIHYMMDHEAGVVIGEQVGKEALKASSSEE